MMLFNRLGVLRFFRIFVLLMAIVGVVALLLFSLRVFGNGKYVINTNRTAVVKQLQALNRYETVSFTIEKIIDAGKAGNALSQLLFGDKLLLIAHGQVIAGFDLSKLTNNSVRIEGTKITLDLPAPEVLFTTLDEGQTRVYDRSTGFLTKGDKDLESKAREAAQLSIQQAACSENILDEAAKNGRNQLTALLKALGFETVVVNIPAASC